MSIQDDRGLLSRPLLSRRGFAGLLGAAVLAGRAGPARAFGAPANQKTVRLPAGLYELVVSTTTNLLHVASTGPRGESTARILGLDLRTLEVRSTIDLGAEAVFGLGLNDRTGTLFGTDTRGGKVVAVDLRTGTVKARIGSGTEAHLREVVVDAAHDRAFASVFGTRDKPSQIWTIDTASNTLAGSVLQGLEGGITGMAYDARNDRIFATALQSNEVVEVSVARQAVTRRFPAGAEAPINIAYDPGSDRVYVTAQKAGQVVALNAATGQPVKVLDTGAGALGLALSADGALAYVANRGAGTVSVVDTRAMTVLGSVATGTHPNSLAVDARSGLAYVTNKAAMGQRGQPPVDDPNGDTVSLIQA